MTLRHAFPPPALHRLWLQWTEPSPEVIDPAERRSARLLATLLLVIIPLGLISATVQLRLVPGFAARFGIIVAALALFSAGYAVIRTRHFRQVAVAVALVPIVASAAVGLVAPGDPAWFAFVTLGPVFASGFLPYRQVGMVGLVSVAVTGAVVWVHRDLLMTVASTGPAILSFGLILPALALLVSWHRGALERVREAQVRESEVRYRTLFEHAPLGIAVVTLDGALLECNDAMLAPGGYSRDDLALLSNAEALYRPAGTWAKLGEELQERGRVVGKEVEMGARNGSYPAVVHLVPVTLAGRAAVLTIVEDIRQRKTSEAERTRISEERNSLAMIVELSLNEIYVFDQDTLRFVYANESARRNVGYSLGQLRALTPVDLKPAFDLASFRAKIAPLLEETTSLLVFETEHRRADGTRYPVEVRLQLASWQGRRVFLAVILDATARKQAEAEVREKQERLQAAELQLRHSQKLEAIGTLAGGIAHDFNNILTAIIGHTELLALALPSDPAVREELEGVLGASFRARDLVRQILTFSRRQEQQRELIALQPVVLEALRLVRSTLPATIEIRTELVSEDVLVVADPTQVHQAVMNLCTNAAHAMRGKGGLLSVGFSRVQVGETFHGTHRRLRPGPYARLTVSDTGHGIEPEILERIFDPFFTTKGPREGTGLGLSVLHGIMQAHDGAVTVESEPGKGASFHLYFPAVAGTAQEDTSVAASLPRGAGGRILVVDDEPAVVAIACRALGQLGYEVTGHTRPLEALEEFRAAPTRFDLVLCDLTMPQMSGLDLATQLLTLRPDLPVVLSTGDGGPIQMDDLQSVGVRDLLGKPFTLAGLAETVHRQLSK